MIIAFKNVSLLDGKQDMQLQRNMTVLVCSGEIISVEKNGKIPSGAKVVDLKHRYMLPGLINMHCHLPGDGKPQTMDEHTNALIQKQLKSPVGSRIMKEMCAKSAKLELLSGVTTIRTVGGLGAIDTWLRDEIHRGKRVGSRIYAANTAISVPGGHMAGSLAYVTHNVEEVKHCTAQVMAESVDVLKLMVTGGTLDIEKLGDEDKVMMAPEMIQAACTMAHEKGIPVSAHIQGCEGAKVALQNGVDTIEHGGDFDEETIALFKEKKAALIGTFTTVASMANLPLSVSGLKPLYQKSCALLLENITRGFKKAIAAGVPIGMGLDNGCPFITHTCMWRELDAFCRYLSLTPEEAIYIATLGNAKILRADHVIGSIEKGKFADFLIVDDNPLEDLRNLSRPYMVVKNGKIINNPLKHYKDKYAKILDMA